MHAWPCFRPVFGPLRGIVVTRVALGTKFSVLAVNSICVFQSVCAEFFSLQKSTARSVSVLGREALF